MSLAKAKKGKINPKQMKRDPMWELYEKVSGNVLPYRDKLLYGVMALVAAIVIGAGIYMFMNYQKSSGQQAFANALEIYNADVIVPGSEEDKNKNAAKKSYPDEQQKYKESAEAFDKVANGYSSHRDLARYYAAISRTHFDNVRAQSELEQLVNQGGDIGFWAKIALAETYLAAAQPDRAIGIYQQLKDNAGPLPKALIFYNLGYLYERQSNNAEAVKAYFESASADRSSAEGHKSQERLNVLDPATAKKLPPEKPKDKEDEEG